MTTAEAVDYGQYTGQKVIVTLAPQGDSKEKTQVEGKVEVGNPLGLMFKAKGKSQVDLIEAASIVAVEAAPEKPKAFKARKLNLTEDGNVRQHLLDRHGIQLDWVNQASDKQATDYHATLNHAELNIGHVHEAPAPAAKSSDADAAIASAEGSA